MSPTPIPAAVRKREVTTAWPGPSSQCPETSPGAPHAESPSYATTVVAPVIAPAPETPALHRDLAAHFRLSEATVKTHVARILAKLRLRDRAQAVVVAYETGLIVPGTAAGSPAPER